MNIFEKIDNPEIVWSSLKDSILDEKIDNPEIVWSSLKDSILDEKIYSESDFNSEYEDLYILIDHSSNKRISEDEWKKYIKDNVYYTIWNEIWYNIYIIDLEKNSILPEVRFLDWFSWWKLSWWFNLIPWLIFVLVLVWIYFYMNNSESLNKTNNIVNVVSPISEKTINNWSELIPWMSNSNIIWSSNPVNIPNSFSLPEKTNIPLKVDKVDNTISLENDIEYYKNQLRIDDLKYDALNSKYNVIISDLSSLNDIILSLKDKNLSCNTELEKQRVLNLSENQLFLSIWKSAFELCKDKNSDVCRDLMYNFYSVREK